ncbi:GntR family transcriptional regulator [Amycolatopsis minnesotensis]|uniref:Trehalose operon repressor n=1 Tax=Amycolatopsis minnesotensis TaxID=337894 RepID=A0ABN2SCF8_9PSEU
MAKESIAHQITADLRDKIEDGTYGPGALLPSEPELAQKYAVSRQTARSALKALEHEGLVVVHSTRGRTVRNRPPLRRISSDRRHTSRRQSGKPEFDTEAIAQGQVASRKILMVGHGETPKDVAKILGIEPHQETVIRKRLQLLDGVPAVISTSYYPLRVAEGTRLESSDALSEGPDNLIEQLGYRFAHGMDLLQARMPTRDEVQLLELDPGVPVVRMLHIDYDVNGETLQVADDLYAADRHEFAFEWSEPEWSD